MEAEMDVGWVESEFSGKNGDEGSEGCEIMR